MIDVIKSHYKNFSKFTLVGGVNTIIDLSVFYFLYDICEAHYIVAHIGGFFCALVNSFIFNALWTFKNLKTDKLFQQVFAFFIIGLIGLGLSTIAIYLLGAIVHSMYIAKIGAMFASFTWNYVGSWLFVFKEKEGHGSV